MEIFLTFEAWASLGVLTVLELVLGIDNLIFLAILAGKLPEHQRDLGRKLGLIGALVTRLGLLSLISVIVGLTKPLFSVMGHDFSGKSLVLLIGGLFLLYSATKEIHDKIEIDEAAANENKSKVYTSLGMVIMQIAAIDIVFSIDSVITAVGMTDKLIIMVLANVIAIAVMLFSAKAITDFVDKHPTVKILALSFLIMIGGILVADGMGFHIPKGYIYFAMAFSLFVEFVNMRASKKRALAERIVGS